MDEHLLLVRHLVEWATAKKREVDTDLVSQALDLRWQGESVESGYWPPGSAERLLLRTWPAGAPRPTDPHLLVESLVTLWRFLRATGRMRSGSASPLELQAEARRAVTHLDEAFEHPPQRSTGEVLIDFGRSIGISLDDAAGPEAANARVQAIQEAWNALPEAERKRLMPLPEDRGAEDMMPRGDTARAARQARDSAYVQGCLALAEWVGARREVTSIGRLRPAVARQAYRELGLWDWERRYAPYRPDDDVLRDPEVERLWREANLESWTTAADCEPVERLWYAVVSARLVEVHATVARSTGDLPVTDEEWVRLAVTLVAAHAARLGRYLVDPLVGVLVAATSRPGGVADLREVRDWWRGQIPAAHLGDRSLWEEIYDDRLTRALDAFADAGMWRLTGDRCVITDLGRECALVLVGIVADGLLD